VWRCQRTALGGIVTEDNLATPVSATVDGAPVTTATAIATKPFIGTYCVWNSPVTLDKGRHEIHADRSDVAGDPTHFTYDIKVTR
jgi:hypothetical protein